MRVKQFFEVLSCVFLLSFSAVGQIAHATSCDTVNATLNVASADTGSRVTGSGSSYSMNASYSSSTSIDVKGSFYKSTDNHAWNGNMLTFMTVNINGALYANNGQGWQSWNGNIDNLPTYSSVSPTSSEISLPINNGTMSPGAYQVSFGYKQGADLPKPGCFFGYYYYYNATPITIRVN